MRKREDNGHTLHSSDKTLVSGSSMYSTKDNITPRIALKKFFRQRVNESMIRYLIKMTEEVINVQEPTRSEKENGFHSLYDFITALVTGSNVQTPTLMSTTIYLRRLKKILPSNVIGISTTRHRMFIGCLIIASKNLNDSSPLNKHWKNYCLNMLTLNELNTIEREILDLFNFRLEFDESELIESLGELLITQNVSLSETSGSYNSYLSSYSTSSSNTVFSRSHKSMNLSTRVSDLSNLTQDDYHLYNANMHPNNEFYKVDSTKSDSNLLTKSSTYGSSCSYNSLPAKSMTKPTHISNSDSLLNVHRATEIRDTQRTMNINDSLENGDQKYEKRSNNKNYRIKHPHFQMDYL